MAYTRSEENQSKLGRAKPKYDESKEREREEEKGERRELRENYGFPFWSQLASDSTTNRK